ncbi:alpha-L-rhamnosidase N-terminal domain-containing protein [candidate division KSB1 bacterium]|nr:alpha-L-rhamnosidase N-terminal domain-containing protein [candidate division KSB1 bacterium]
MKNPLISRRRFFQAGAGLAAVSSLTAQSSEVHADSFKAQDAEHAVADKKLDLSPAQWLWYPCERVLQNTVILFRRQFSITLPIKSARGWILGDSRYKLFVNGTYIQYGPAPADPRWAEADPIDIKPFLKPGDNVIGAQVLYFGQGDGTWPMGKPGFIFRLEIELSHGTRQLIYSDPAWFACIATSWRPGTYKRWYLRAFQEEFDARCYPYGWTTPDYKMSDDWLPAMTLQGAADKPALATNADDYLYNSGGLNETTQLRRRSIPLMRESTMPAKRLAESHWLEWRRPAREYFDCKTPNAFRAASGPACRTVDDGWEIHLDPHRAAVLTFEFTEQIVGWPGFEIDAPAGTTIELMVQEAHRPFGTSNMAPGLMNNKFHSWTRFICREGVNVFETFDYESFRWLQLHICNADGRVVLKYVGARRRLYAWPNNALVSVSSSKIQKVIDAAINTMHNSAQDLIVDGMARERQQYSGDVGHVLHASILAFGAAEQVARYLNTFSQGLTKDGYFMDCWPAYDRLNRIAQRQLDLTPWGPLLDHGVGFNFDCYHYYMYTGDLVALEEVFPRLLRFYAYLKSLIREDGLLPTDDIGTPAVWIEHGVSKRHIKCSFNLYVAAMLKHAFAEICRAKGERSVAEDAIRTSTVLVKNTIAHFWSPTHRLFISNLPWLHEEGEIKLHDRTLATAILFDFCPENDSEASVKALVERPKELHLSYPANAGWQLWALGKAGRVDKILDDLEGRWFDMPSVGQNNTLGEWFDLQPDSHNQWCHAPVAPLYVMYMTIAGIKPLTPGMQRLEIRPQLDRLDAFHLICYSPAGPISLKGKGKKGERDMEIVLPPGCQAELVVPQQEKLQFRKIAATATENRFELNNGISHNFRLNHI